MTQTQQPLELAEKKALPGSRFALTITIPAEVLSAAYEDARAALQKETSMKGFRKGHVPLELIEKEFGRPYIFKQAALRLFEEHYPAFIQAQQLDVIGQPKVVLQRADEKEGAAFEVEVSVLPEITLPDYQKIAKKHLKEQVSVSVSDKEVDEAVTHIRKQRAQYEALQKQLQEGVKEPNVPPLSEIAEKDLPPLDDAFVKTLGDFQNVADFTAKLKENIKTEKQLKEEEKQRLAFAEDLIASAKLELPDVLIDAELERMWRQFEADLLQQGITMENYLAETKQSKQDILAQWKEGAYKRAALQLLLNKIAEAEAIKPDQKKLEREVSHILAQYPGADKESATAFVATRLVNDAVFERLRSLVQS